MKKRYLLLMSLMAGNFMSFAQFTANRLVVSQYGDGSVVTDNAKTVPVLLKEFKTTLENAPAENVATYTHAMPTSGAGAGVNYPLTGTMGPSYEGLISLSGNGQYITMLGFGLVPGSAVADADIRVLATVDVDGNVNSITNVKGSANNLKNPRSAATINGTGYWTIGDAGGIRYRAAGYIADKQTTSIENSYSSRSVTVFNGKLYVAATAAASPRVYIAAKTTDPVDYLPTASTGVAVTGLAGLSATTPNQLLFFRMDGATSGDPDLLYFTNDGDNTIEKWVYSTSTWVKKGEISVSDKPKGITGQIDPSNNKVYVYATSDTRLFKFEDSNYQTSTLSNDDNEVLTLATAPTNTKFRGVSLTPNSPTTLPVKLTSFTGKQQQQTVKLNWTTASEQNNAYFEVLHATDGANFSALDKVTGNGTSNAPHSYSFVDENPSAGTNYYQLNQVDFNGESQKSNVIAVKTNIEGSSFSVFLSEDNQVQANIYAANTTTAQFSVTDITGRKLASTTLNLTKGYNKASLNLPGIQQGVYVASITISGKTQSVKFIK